jgi:hypothetical protein
MTSKLAGGFLLLLAFGLAFYKIASMIGIKEAIILVIYPCGFAAVVVTGIYFLFGGK